MKIRVLLLCALFAPAVLAMKKPCVDKKDTTLCQKQKGKGKCDRVLFEVFRKCKRTCSICCRERTLKRRKLSPLFGSFGGEGEVMKIEVAVESADKRPYCDELCDDGTLPPCPRTPVAAPTAAPVPAPNPKPVPVPVAAPTAAPTVAGETVFFSKVPESSVAEITAKTILNWKLDGLDDDDMTYVASLMTDGDPPPMANTVTLGFESNDIGDAGMSTFAGALSGGGSLDNLDELWLNKNKIGDAGLTAFANAIVTSPLPLAKLTALDLQGGRNSYTFDGMKALSTAIKNGALPNLNELRLDYARPGLTEEQADEIRDDVGHPTNVVVRFI